MFRLNSMKLAPRLALGFSLVIALVGAMTALSWQSLRQSQDGLAAVVAALDEAQDTDRWRALTQLKELGVWTIGLAGDATQSYESVDWTQASAVVLGAEGAGLRRLVRETCDVVVSIPLAGHVESLNVSVAAGVVLFEAGRQRRR